MSLVCLGGFSSIVAVDDPWLHMPAGQRVEGPVTHVGLRGGANGMPKSRDLPVSSLSGAARDL